MDCIYSANPFCRRAYELVGDAMCAKCRFKLLMKSQILTISYWNGSFAVLLDGLIAAGYPDANNGKALITGLASNGTIVGNSKAFRDCPAEMTGRTVYCMTKCTVAVWDEDYVYDQCCKNRSLGMFILKHSFHNYWYEKEAFARAVTGRSVYEAVRYIVSYCTERGIPPLTHEQIAMLCNRARPTVTNTIQELLRNEPGLFHGWS